MTKEVMTVGDRIKRIRKIYGLSQVGFAESLGVTSAYISKIEKGFDNISDTFLNLVSCKFNVTVEYLKTGKEEPTQEADTATAPPHPGKPDASELINMFTMENYNNGYEEIDKMLENDTEWKKTNDYVYDQFEKLKNFVVCLSCNPENGESVERLEDNVSNMKFMYGNACFIAGLKKGLLLMQWAAGEIKINPRDMVL